MISFKIKKNLKINKIEYKSRTIYYTIKDSKKRKKNKINYRLIVKYNMYLKIRLIKKTRF